MTHPPVQESPTVQRRRLDFKTWPDVLADIDQLRQGHYDRVGNWDLSQTLEHVGEGLRTALRGTDHRAAWIIRRFLGPLVLNRILLQRLTYHCVCNKRTKIYCLIVRNSNTCGWCRKIYIYTRYPVLALQYNCR